MLLAANKVCESYLPSVLYASCRGVNTVPTQSIMPSLLAGLATGLGGVLVVLFGRPSRTQLAVILGLAAGINIAVATFELLPESIGIGGIGCAVIGFLSGTALMYLADRWFPDMHLVHTKDLNSLTESKKMLRIGLFFALGIAVHNIPEGMAIGAGFAAARTLGLLIAVVIGLHNIPEGMGSAAPLKTAGLPPLVIVAITTADGLFTPLGTLLGLLLISVLKERFVATALALGAGAIVYVASKEIIPASYEQHEHYATLGIALGYVLTLVVLF